MQWLQPQSSSSIISLAAAGGSAHLDDEVGLIVRDQFGGTTRHTKVAALSCTLGQLVGTPSTRPGIDQEHAQHVLASMHGIRFSDAVDPLQRDTSVVSADLRKKDNMGGKQIIYKCRTCMRHSSRRQQQYPANACPCTVPLSTSRELQCSDAVSLLALNIVGVRCVRKHIAYTVKCDNLTRRILPMHTLQ